MISNHTGNEECKASTSENNGKKNKGTSKIDSNKKEKEYTNMESMQQMIKQLMTKIVYLKKNKGEGKKPFNPFIKKRTNIDTPPHIAPNLEINLEDYAMDNFCHTHHANHSNKTCPNFINSFSVVLVPPKPPKKGKNDEDEEDNDDEEEEEAKEEEPPSRLNLIWDEIEVDKEDDDVMEEACVGNNYILRSKGVPTSNNSPSTLKTATKKTLATTTSTSKETSTEKSFKKDKTNEKDSTTNKTTKNMDISQKILSDLKLDYDVVEDLKKMKEISHSLITQLREKLCKSIQHIQGSQDLMVGNRKETPKGKHVKANKMTRTSSVANTSVNGKAKTTYDQNKGDPKEDGGLIGKNSKLQTPLFLLTFEMFNHNFHNYLFDFGDSSNVMSYSICKKFNAEPQISKTRIIQLGRSNVNVMGEFNFLLLVYLYS